MLEVVYMLLIVLTALAGTFFAITIVAFALIVLEVVWIEIKEQYEKWFH